MRSLTMPAALLMLALFACTAVQNANGQKKQPGTLPTQCRFGWVPVTFDTETAKQQPLTPRRRPRLLNYRCTEACAALGLSAVTTIDNKPLCATVSIRQLGATYNIYGTWYEGIAEEDYESTCRARTETGAQYREWAMRWNTTTEQMTYGFQCACSGCVQSCSNVTPPSFRSNVTNGTWTAPTGEFQCRGALQPWGLTELIDSSDPNNPPAENQTMRCARAGREIPGGPVQPAWDFPYDVCVGGTAGFGFEWGTVDVDSTCATFNARTAVPAEALCTAQARTLPAIPMPRPAPRPRAMYAPDAETDRLDILLGVETPKIATDQIPSGHRLAKYIHSKA